MDDRVIGSGEWRGGVRKRLGGERRKRRDTEELVLFGAGRLARLARTLNR